MLFEFHDEGVEAFLVDGAHGASRHIEFHGALEFWDKKTLHVDIREKGSFGSSFGVGDIVSNNGFLAREFTCACHRRNAKDK